MNPLKIKDRTFSSRLLLGTGKFPSNETMREAIEAGQPALVTVALRRIDLKKRPASDAIIDYIDRKKFVLLPNTSGARNAREALLLARLAREAGLGDWLKLEVIPDPQYLLPDPIETLEAARLLSQEGFTVLPYMQADPILAKRLVEAGCPVVMPLAAPIGSNRGLKMREALRIIIEQATVPVIVDAGLGVPSHACDVLEMGADAVLVNTAIATAADPVAMAVAFREAVQAGRRAFLAGRAKAKKMADASSPLEGRVYG